MSTVCFENNTNTILPELGLDLTSEQKLDLPWGYDQVCVLIASEAWDSISNNQKVCLVPMVGWILPASSTHNGRLRLLPLAQTAPEPWRKVDAIGKNWIAQTKEMFVIQSCAYLKKLPLIGGL